MGTITRAAMVRTQKISFRILRTKSVNVVIGFDTVSLPSGAPFYLL